MADTHTLASIGAAVWAVVGGAVALSQVPAANDDAVILVGVCSVLGPAFAIAAAVWAARRMLGLAGAMLVVSALATPTYFAYPLNVLVLVGGVWLLATARGRASMPDRQPA